MDRLMALRRAAEAVWQTIDVLVVATIPTPYTVEAVVADPIRLNSNLGTYTNFVNLLDLAALAIPTGVRGDGLPCGITMIAPAGRDSFLAGLGLAVAGQDSEPVASDADVMEIAVIGAHLSGLPLNGQITGRGGMFKRTGQTTPDYRLSGVAAHRISDNEHGPRRLRIGRCKSAAKGHRALIR